MEAFKQWVALRENAHGPNRGVNCARFWSIRKINNLFHEAGAMIIAIERSQNSKSGYGKERFLQATLLYSVVVIDFILDSKPDSRPCFALFCFVFAKLHQTFQSLTGRFNFEMGSLSVNDSNCSLHADEVELKAEELSTVEASCVERDHSVESFQTGTLTETQETVRPIDFQLFFYFIFLFTCQISYLAYIS